MAITDWFYRRGTSAAFFLPAIAGSSPTSGEMAAGTNLSDYVVAINGWNFTNQRIDVPVLSSSFVTQIAGPDQAAESSLDFAERNSNTNPPRTVCAKNTPGFIVLCPRGNVSGAKCEIFPVTSTGVNRDWSTGNDHAKYSIGYAITGAPNQEGTLP